MRNWFCSAVFAGLVLCGYGAAFSAAWFVDNKWMPFFRAGASKGTAALYERSISAGLGYYGRNTDLAGLGLNWAEARGIDGDQFTLEAFYRFSISPGLQITPSVQFISDPLLNPDQDRIGFSRSFIVPFSTKATLDWPVRSHL